MTKLAVENLHLSYGALPILKGVSVSVSQGEIVVLLGPSGSGKTTLLRAIAGHETPSGGTITIDGVTAFDGARRTSLSAERRNLGLVFQSYALWPHKTVEENVDYGLRLRGVGKAEREDRTRTALAGLGLIDLAKRFPHQLSGGQQQRVAIARALIYNPPVILLDEPLSNLDAKLRDEAKAWLRTLIRELQLSAIVVTHDQNEAMALADKVLLLNDGLVVQEGSPVEIYSKPRSIFAAEFFGTTNRFVGAIKMVGPDGPIMHAGPFDLMGSAQAPLSPGDKAVGIVRAERLRVVDGQGRNRIRLPLVQSLFGGDRWEHFFRVGENMLRAYSPTHLEEGEYWIEIKPSDLWIFNQDSAPSALSDSGDASAEVTPARVASSGP